MFIGIDNCGQHWHIKKHPRKELCEQLGRKSASKMYQDRKDGTYHVGYVIDRLWITVYGLEGVTFAKLA